MGPDGDLVMDGAGNLYGVANSIGSNQRGFVFELSPSLGGWTYTVLHEFSVSGHEGKFPVGGVVLDAAGNLYGTASAGGTYDKGTVWEITP